MPKKFLTKEGLDNVLAAVETRYGPLLTHNHDGKYLGLTATAADSDKLDGKHLSEIVPWMYYDANSGTGGILIATDLLSIQNHMTLVEIKGNAYAEGIPIDSVLQFYNYVPYNSILQYRAINNGKDIGPFSVFVHDGVVKIWIPHVGPFATYFVTVRTQLSPLYNHVTSITLAEMPTEGVSRLVTVTPSNAVRAQGTATQFIMGDGSLKPLTDITGSYYDKTAADARFAPTGHDHDSRYLGIADKAHDSGLLGGLPPSYFMQNRGWLSTPEAYLDADGAAANTHTYDYRWVNTPDNVIASLLDLTYSPDWRTQLFIPHHQNAGISFRHRYNGTTWGAWRKLLDEGNYAATLDSRYHLKGELDYLNIQDLRFTQRLPSQLHEKRVSAWFKNTDTPGNTTWYSGLSFMGWTPYNNYAAWEIAANATNNSEDRNLYFRTGIGESWHPWQQILTDTNYAETLDSRYYTEAEADGRFARLGMANNFVFAGNEVSIVPEGYDNDLWINYRAGNGYGHIFTYNIGDGNQGYADVMAKGFKVNGGTASQFMKADGSLDSNAYFHAGNMGAGSGLNADMVDGIHGTELARGGYATYGGAVTEAGWIRIARLNTQASGIVAIQNQYAYMASSGVVLSFTSSYASVNAQRASIVQLGGVNYLFSKARIVYPTSSSGDLYCYLEVYYNSPNPNALYISLANSTGVELMTSRTAGSVPDGYAAKEITLTNGIAAENVVAETVYANTLNVASSGLVSNLNADMLDGYHASSFLRQVVISSPQDLDANTLTADNTIYTTTSDIGSWSTAFANFPTAKPHGSFFLINIREGAYKKQIYSAYQDNHLYVRRSSYLNGEHWGEWEKVAFTGDNVASATKLSDNGTYTAWGQTFFENGKPKNVSDSLTLFTGSPTTGGWAREVLAKDSAGNDLGGFGLYGLGNALEYAYIGNSHSAPWVAVTPAGNVGIGTPTPAYPLDVNGNGRFVTGLIVGTVPSGANVPMFGIYSQRDIVSDGNVTAKNGLVDTLLVNAQGMLFKLSNAMIIDSAEGPVAGTQSIPFAKIFVKEIHLGGATFTYDEATDSVICDKTIASSKGVSSLVEE